MNFNFVFHCRRLSNVVDFGTYFQSWAQDIQLLTNANIKYLTLPTKTLPIYFNVTSIQARAALGGLLFFGAGKFLVLKGQYPKSNNISLFASNSNMYSMNKRPPLDIKYACICKYFLFCKLLILMFPFCFRELEATDPSDPKLLTFVTSSFSEWIRNLGFVNWDGGFLPGFFITFPDKGNNLFLNSTTRAFPLAYTLAGAAMVAYVSEYYISILPLYFFFWNH